MTSENSARASTTPVSATSFSRQLVCGPSGPSAGLRMHIQTMVARNSAVRIRPGTTAATNRRSSDCSVCTAITISTTLGGITTPERAAHGDGAAGQRRVVAITAHFRHGDGTHGRRGRRIRAADR
jgi:hypothetical protein